MHSKAMPMVTSETSTVTIRRYTSHRMPIRRNRDTAVTFKAASFTAVVKSAIIAGSPVTCTSVPEGTSRSSTTERSHITSSSEAGEPTADRSPTTR